jgi:hypothetical protein
MGTEIQDLQLALRSYGYVVTTEPLEGSENEYVAHLRSALNRVVVDADFARRRHGFRGKSKALLEYLHQVTPSPAWGVEPN